MRSIAESQRQQQELIDAVRLPAAQLCSFDGNPMKYWTFIRAFDHSVASSSVDDGAKLTRLIHFCVGKARKVIECCSIIDPALGYKRARQILAERFGDSFVIAESWIRKITDYRAIKPAERELLLEFSDDLNCCQETLASMGYEAEINNQSTLLKIISRLPTYLQIRWRGEVPKIRDRSRRNPNIADVVDFVKKAACEVNDPVYGAISIVAPEPSRDGRLQQQGNARPRGTTFVTMSSQSGTGSEYVSTGRQMSSRINRACVICGNGHTHTLFGCQRFKDMRVDERITLVKQKQLCFNCLRPNHKTIDCYMKRTCSVPGCGKRHTKFLHPTSREDNNSAPATGIQDHGTVNGYSKTKSVDVSKYTGVGTKRIVLPILPVIVRSPESQLAVMTYALLDSGSTKSFCSKDLSNQLQLQGKTEVLSLTTLEKRNSRAQTTVVDLLVSDINCENTVEINRVYTRRMLPINMENIATSNDVKQWPHLGQVPLPQIVDCKSVGLLIGQDVPEALMPREVIGGNAGSSFAVRTLLGWTLNGPIDSESECVESTVSANFVHADVTLEQQVERFWKIESIESPSNDEAALSVNDRRAMKIWNESAKYVDGRYEFDIPFKYFPPNLPDNESLARQRLESLRRRLVRNDNLKEKYCSGMNELLKNGYSELVPADEIEATNTVTCYLPHHPVFSVNKPEGVRIVFDCAAKYNGVSLNDQVLQGPDLTNKLIGVLLRFREERIAVMADIEAMFHQVRVSRRHRDALRFLWWSRGDTNADIQIYRMKAHLFGGVWSPSCCSYALKRTATDNQNKFHCDVTKTIDRNFYVDDCLKSVNDEERAIWLVAELRQLLALGGFKLTKWISNNRQVLLSIPDEYRAKEIRGKNLLLDELPSKRVLGIRWCANSDVLGYEIAVQTKPLTRRGILSVVSAVYDPLGLVGPFILPAKHLLRELSRKKIGWDEPLEEADQVSWRSWLSDLPKLEQIRIDRCLKPASFVDPIVRQLHHFSDASNDGYGTATYIRLQDANGRIHSTLVMSKCRVAPIRQMTIPRLELTAATLSVKMDKLTRRELDIEIHESVFWTDSTTVLQYINNTDKRFQTFVANRITVIHEGSVQSQWRYVETKSNPADDASRGLRADELLNNRRWFDGPGFLWQPESEWPVNLVNMFDDGLDDTVKEFKPSICCATNTMNSDSADCDVMNRLFKRRSDWNKLKKDVAWLIRAKQWLMAKATGKTLPNMVCCLDVAELERAETNIVSYVQREAFPAEVLKLTKTSRLYRLEPTRLEDDLLRVGGRLPSHPVILPSRHDVVNMIIRHFHELSGHSGKEHVLALIRHKYWIIDARPAVRRVLKECMYCKRRNPKPMGQRMADLPYDRITPCKPPFTFVGVDLFGPFTVKRGRSELKPYGCLFTCLAVRDVHIEVVQSLETDSFLQALQRFICRRGPVEVIRSDNGTNFVGAAKELRRAVESWNQNQIHSFLQQRAVQWQFNPPSASHMGGVWERQIRSVRKILQALMTEQCVDDEGLTTLMCLVESIVNGRPLTSVSDDHRDLEPLTPNHLLLLRSGATVPPGEFVKEDMYCRKRWRQVQYLADVFWRRWTREYLPTLQLRRKWNEPVRNVEVGDVVILMEDNAPRNSWQLGRVTETFPGPDGLVRSVKLTTRGTTLTRPIHKLCLLEPVKT